jgi:AcrR family transcriptional regulator
MKAVTDTSDGTVHAKRSYTMRSRARSVERTRQEIVDAAFSLWEERVTFMIGLADVAERAGVTIRTVLRHFGNRDGLFEAVGKYALELISEERGSPVGDVDAAVRSVVDHYEKRGRHALRMLEEETLDPTIAGQTQHGRRFHREWVRTVFAPQLARATDPDALLDLLVVATDVYTWKLLRLDRGLSRTRVEQRITTMIRRLAEEGA